MMIYVFFGDIDSDTVTFFSNDIYLNNIKLNNINLDNDNFDNYDLETISHVKLGIIGISNTKHVKKDK